MKTIKLLLIICVLLASCNSKRYEEHPKRQFGLNIINWSGLTTMVTQVYCDSFDMLTPQKATIWVDGTKLNIESNSHIQPFNNQ